MKIYGKTDDLVVREMTENDLKPFFEYVKETGNKEGLDLDDVKVLWEFRNKKSDIQCVITSADVSETIYGFCAILHTDTEMMRMSIGFLKNYDSAKLRQQVKEIMTRMS